MPLITSQSYTFGTYEAFENNLRFQNQTNLEIFRLGGKSGILVKECTLSKFLQANSQNVIWRCHPVSFVVLIKAHNSQGHDRFAPL